MGIDRTNYTPLYRQVADTLRAEILAGDPAPGEYLPVEGALTGRFGVGKATVRDALGILRGEGLIKTERGIGTLVLDWGRRRVEKAQQGDRVRFRAATAEERRTLDLPADSYVAVLTTADGEVRVFPANAVEFLFGEAPEGPS